MPKCALRCSKESNLQPATLEQEAVKHIYTLFYLFITHIPEQRYAIAYFSVIKIFKKALKAKSESRPAPHEIWWAQHLLRPASFKVRRGPGCQYTMQCDRFLRARQPAGPGTFSSVFGLDRAVGSVQFSLVSETTIYIFMKYMGWSKDNGRKLCITCHYISRFSPFIFFGIIIVDFLST